MISVCIIYQRPTSSLCFYKSKLLAFHISFYNECVERWISIIRFPKQVKITTVMYLLCQEYFNIEIQDVFARW